MKFARYNSVCIHKLLLIFLFWYDCSFLWNFCNKFTKYPYNRMMDYKRPVLLSQFILLREKKNNRSVLWALRERANLVYTWIEYCYLSCKEWRSVSIICSIEWIGSLNQAGAVRTVCSCRLFAYVRVPLRYTSSFRVDINGIYTGLNCTTDCNKLAIVKT